MSKDAKNVPALRFKGYSDAWEKRKYGDITKSFQYGLNAPAKKFDGINKYLRITDIDDHTRLFKQESLTSPDTNLSNASTYLLKQGDVLFARTGASTGKTYKYRKREGKVYFAGFLIRAELKPKFDSEFFYQTTLTDSFLDFVKVTSQRSGQPGINSKEYANKAIQVPELSEQQRIGSVLAIYDNLIAATQHKIDALEQVKKALLQRLFDQSWRFDGYLETWKKYRLGDHAEILTGGTPKTSVAEYWEPKSIPWMSSGEVNKVYLDQTDTMISLEGFKNSSARWVKKHSILIALAGQGKTRGTVAVNNIALTTNQSIAAIIPGKDLYYEFVFQNLTNRYNELRLISSGDGTRGGLNKQIVSDVTIHSPNLNEQIRIGKLLSKVDHLSTENQLKLSRIELIKKYLLQTLFI